MGLALICLMGRNGTQVLVTRIDPLQEVPMKGSVVSSTTTQLRVAFQEPFGLEGGTWRLVLGHAVLYNGSSVIGWISVARKSSTSGCVQP
jgi:hypothetical protein